MVGILAHRHEELGGQEGVVTAAGQGPADDLALTLGDTATPAAAADPTARPPVDFAGQVTAALTGGSILLSIALLTVTAMVVRFRRQPTRPGHALRRAAATA